jgi:hypothetical protein
LGEQIMQTIDFLLLRIEQPLHYLRVVAVRVEGSQIRFRFLFKSSADGFRQLFADLLEVLDPRQVAVGFEVEGRLGYRVHFLLFGVQA